MSTEETPKTKPSLFKASGSVGLSTLLSRVLGLFRDMLIAKTFGAGAQTDAFFVAFRIPNLLRSLLAEGSLSTAFMPVLAEEERKSHEAAVQAVRAILSFMTIITIVLSIIGMFYAKELTLLFAPGFGEGTAKTELASYLLRIMFPYLVLVTLLALAGGVLNAHGSFALPALGPAIMNLVMLISMLLIPGNAGIEALAWSVLLGGVIALAPQVYLTYRKGFSLRWASPLSNPAVGKVCKLMLPAVFSSSLYQILIFINTLLASLLIERSISWLFYADRLFQFPIGVFSLAIATALLPSLSRRAAAGDIQGLGDEICGALRWTVFIAAPATAGLIILGEPIIRTLFERGQFSAYDTTQSARALVAYCIGIIPASCQSILIRSFLAQKRVGVATAINSASVVVNILLALMLLGPAQTESVTLLSKYLASFAEALNLLPLGHVGLALAWSLATWFACILSALMLRKVGVKLNLAELLHSFSRTFVATNAMSAALITLMRLDAPSVFLVFIGIPLGAIIYWASGLMLNSSESLATKEVSYEYLRKWKRKN
ncbi:murein biosynthesis integral membrane protein MurJ [bacterium]|nr:murein biosynthesis integral membrane protein MurJ [bacterium]